MLGKEILTFLNELKRKSIELSVHDEKIKVHAPKEAVTSEIKEQIVQYRDEIITFLNKNKDGLKLPVLHADVENRYEPFSLTDVQQAYWVGRNSDYDLGNVATHVYYEFEEENLNSEGIEKAWNRLIKRHDMLRAVVHTDGSQQILKQVPEYKIPVMNLEEETEDIILQKINEIRNELSHQVLPSDHWPLFDLRITRLPGNVVRLHVSVDLLIADGLSCQILLKELADLYHNQELELIPVKLTFRDYVIYYEEMKETDVYKEALDYWKQRVPELPGAPLLKLKNEPESIKTPHFIRKSASLTKENWSQLKSIAKKHDVTPSMVLLTAYVNVLRVWSKYAHFCINVTLFNRPPLNDEINSIIGDFTSLNLLEVNMRNGMSFCEQVKEIQNRMWKDLDHQCVSGIQVMREMAKEQGTSKGVSMPVVFTSELLTADDNMFEVSYDEKNSTEWNVQVSGIGKQVYGISQTPQVWLDHQVGERAGSLTFNWDIMEELFDSKMLNEMFDCYCELLERLVKNPTIWDEKNASLVNYKTPYVESKSIFSLEDIKSNSLVSIINVGDKKYSSHTAIISEERRLSYGDLERLSNQIANWLLQKRAKKNELVGILMEKGWEQIVAAVGILKSGAAYLPISADLPKERIQSLLEDSDTKFVLSVDDKNILGKINNKYQVLCVNCLEKSGLSEEKTGIEPKPEDLAYVIYTSGSTGKPKGVMISHEGAVNTIIDIKKRYQLKDRDRIFAISALNFDLSVFDIFGTFAAKGAIVIPGKEYEKNPMNWYEMICKERVTIWNSVPALVEMFIEYAEGVNKPLPSDLRLIMMSGDWIPVSLVNRIFNMNRALQMVSLGGATEASIWSIYHEINSSDTKRKSIPYGRPLSNQKVYILDDVLEVRGKGIPGKIYISGKGLALGYWKNEEKTNESFMIHPITKERLYFTGDWGCYEEDGTIIFLGREDNQVKVGGYRIELGEIEAVMAQFEGIKTVAAVIKEEQNHKSKSIVTYYDTLDGDKVDEEALKQYLKEALPSYMMPGFIYHLEQMPLTSNGKINRKVLMSQSTSAVEKEYVAPVTKIEKSLIEILEKELKVQNIGLAHNYFELGGDSIVAIRLLVSIRKTFDIEITAKLIFEHPTIKELANEISKLCGLAEYKEEEKIEKPQKEIKMELPKINHMAADEYEPYPLTELQQAYYVGRFDAVAFGNVACHTYEEIDVRDFKLDKFTRAWRKLIDRHDVLRTIIQNDGTQQMLKDLPDYEIELIDISSKQQDEKEKLLLNIRENMSHKVIDVTKWPLFDLKATRIDDRITRLHIGIDAMIADAWSVGILSEEVCKMYEDENYYLEPLEITYRDYVVGEIALRDTDTFKESLEYWRNILSTLEPAPDLPLVKDFSTVSQPKFKRRRKELNPVMWNQLKQVSACYGLTASGIMLAAFAEVLTHWCKSHKFTLNIPQFNRLPLHRQVDDLIGEFASFYLMPIDNSASNRFIDRAKKIQSDLWQHMNHSVVSGVQMLREYSNMHGNGQTLSMPIVYTSTIGLMDQDNSPFDGFGDVIYSISQTPQVWLDCQIGEKGDTVIFNWDAVEEIFPEGMLDDMFQGYCKLLELLAYNESAWNQEVFNLLPSWQNELIDKTNQTFVDLNPELLQCSFAKQAENNPDKVAVITKEKALSYHTLYCYAHQLGNWLREQGAKPNTIVSIVMEKGWEQIVAIMSILNAGAAYAPVDVDLPEERICYILKNSETKVVLTQSRLKELIQWPEDVTVCCIDEFVIDENLKPEVYSLQNVDDLAYLIYTSGSTGEPKGVMITHRNVYNMVWHTNKYLNITEEDKAIAVTALHHDLSVYDVFGMLSAGAAIVIPNQKIRLDVEHLYEMMESEQITLWNSVPAILEMYVQHLEENKKKFDAALRQVIIGGDCIPVTLPDRIRKLGKNIKVLGIGGPTETTVWNIWSPVGKVEAGQTSIPYGKPISNSQYFVLDEKLSKRPVWVVGELYCAGTQLAKGYWKDEEKTKDKFFTHPETGERIYRTGDLGRYLPDGSIEFAGRSDFQVKINGLRIELGEIEHTILEVPNVRQAVACVFDDNNSKNIVAFVVNNAAFGDEIDSERLDEVNVISDPIARLEFKQKKLGIRKNTGMRYVELPYQEIDDEEKQIYINRRSYRYFVKNEISIDVIGRLFSCLRYIKFDSLPFPKYRYASAGGLYPLQVYLYAKPGRIEGFIGGTYYYKPDEHKFMILSEGSEIDGTVFPPGNKEIYDESAFAIFLVGNLEAIESMYGPLTEKFCYLEAGIVCQMLETIALENDLGFCQIGSLDFESIRDLFKLNENHKFLHCILGGGVDQTKDKYQALVDDMSGYKLSVQENSGSNNLEDTIKEVLEEKLPNYMVPSRIIMLDKLPVTPNGKIDRKLLSSYDIGTSDDAIDYVAPQNEIEKKLIELISTALDKDKIGVNHNIFKIGADSLVAIQLSSQIKKVFQVEISLRNLFSSANIKALADEIVAQGGTIGEDADYKDEMPVLEKDLVNRYEPFPLTDVQQAYWVGRNSFVELGNVSTHVYLEIEQHGMDLQRFEEVWQKIIARHEMLRAIIRNDGMQQILEKVPYYHIERISMTDLNQERKNEELQKIRDCMSHQILKADEWPLFEIKASILDESTLRLHVSIDLLISDVWSSRIVTKELMELYSGVEELPQIDLSFRDYVLAVCKLQNTSLFQKSWDYWMERIKTLPEAPNLPLIKDPATLDKPHFERRVATIEKKYWDKLKEKANNIGVTHSGLLAAAYSEILATWSKSSHFTLNLTLFNRLPIHEQVNGIVGDFTSLILLEIDDRKLDTFEERVIRIQQQILEDIDHRYVSGVKVIRELSRKSKNGLKATMPVVFTSTLNLGATEYPSGSLDSGDDVYGISQTPQIWLDHVVSEQDGCLVMNWDAVEELFPKGMLDQMFEAYLNLLYKLANDESAWKLSIAELVPLSEVQKEIRRNGIVKKEFISNTLNELFNKKAKIQPDNIAVIHKDRTLTYGELAGLSNQIGNLVREKNNNQLVAVIMDKGWEQIVAALGILQSGYAYLPISPDLPQERIQYLLQNAKVEVALTVSVLRDKLNWLTSVEKVEVDQTASYSIYSTGSLEVQQREEDLAYVIYTSGSTGQPKGVMIPHKGAVNTILDINERYQITSEDRAIAVSELNFDLSVYDTFGMLAAGGTVVIPEAARRKDPSCWLELLEKEQVTIWNSVPALMDMLAEYTKGSQKVISSSLRLVLLSGDWIPIELPGKLKELSRKIQLVSLGGATEASIWSNYYEVSEVQKEWKSIPYGKPLTNQTMYILDEHLAERADWVPGRIYIGGEGLALGYLNDEELTNSKFIIKKDTNERLYYTGDLGRYLPDGNIEFLGREDFQVKIQGYRIELGEIENAMNEYPGIKNSIANLYEDENGTKSLIGYYIKDKEVAEKEGKELTVLASAKTGFTVENEPVIDPVERLAFKLKYKSIREKENFMKTFPLTVEKEALQNSSEFIIRRSYRSYRKDVMTSDQLNGILSCLTYYTDNELKTPKMQYASAGSLYPVQAYVYIKEKRVEGFSEGMYYYNPIEHCLIKMSDCHIEDDFYPAGNKEIFSQAAFSIILVGNIDAIEPMYGDWAEAFINLEAGSICQLLESESTKYQVGLCQIGSMDFTPIEEYFKLDGKYVFVQNLVGGIIAEEDCTVEALREATKELKEIVNLVELVASTSETAEQAQIVIQPVVKTETKKTISDPIERTKFKLKHEGVRKDIVGSRIDFTRKYIEASCQQFIERRSYREFHKKAISLENISALLGSMRCEKIDDVPFVKRRYASAGNLYPVQVYLYAKPGAIEGLEGGTYYYNPMEHTLNTVFEGVVINDDVFQAGNREIFEQAGFAAYLVAKAGAIAPLYPKDAYKFCMLEAGEISYLLERNSTKYQIGLCQIGSFEFEQIKDYFKLDSDHVYLHCILGGAITQEDATMEKLIQSTSDFYNVVQTNNLDAIKNIDSYHLGTGSMGQQLDVKKFREFLLKKIPKHEVPVTFMQIMEIPLSANGKVDRRSLPKPEQQSKEKETKDFVLPDTELEIKISKIWKDVVGINKVGIYDNFFDLGGNSMHLVKAYNRIKDEISADLPITALFEHPTIYTLSRFIQKINESDNTLNSDERAERRMERRTKRRERK